MERILHDSTIDADLMSTNSPFTPEHILYAADITAIAGTTHVYTESSLFDSSVLFAVSANPILKAMVETRFNEGRYVCEKWQGIASVPASTIVEALASKPFFLSTLHCQFILKETDFNRCIDVDAGKKELFLQAGKLLIPQDGKKGDFRGAMQMVGDDGVAFCDFVVESILASPTFAEYSDKFRWLFWLVTRFGLPREGDGAWYHPEKLKPFNEASPFPNISDRTMAKQELSPSDYSTYMQWYLGKFAFQHNCVKTEEGNLCPNLFGLGLLPYCK